MIYKEITRDNFALELSENKDSGFSYEGACALYNYLDSSGMDIEFDPVALRCDYSEYTKEELINDYGHSSGVTLDDFEDEEEYNDAIIEYVEDNTILIPFGYDEYIILNF